MPVFFALMKNNVCRFALIFCCFAIPFASAQQGASVFNTTEQPQVSFVVSEEPPQLQNVAQAFRQLPVPMPKRQSAAEQPAEQPTAEREFVQPASYNVENTVEVGVENNISKDEDKTVKNDEVLDQPLSFSKNEKNKDGKKSKLSSPVAPVISVVSSLLIVLSLFLCMALLFKKFSRQSGGRLLPSEAFENLGKTCLSPKIQLQLLRLGNRLILVSVTADGISAITEITDPDEVVQLLGMCRRQDKNSAIALFQKTLAEVEKSEQGSSEYFTANQRPTIRAGNDNSRSRRSSNIDLVSEPDNGLAGILANGIPSKGGRYA